MNSQTETIVIVGAGLSGLYAAYRLKSLNQRFQVSIYESSSRLGGRIETIEMSGKFYDVGGVRVEPQISPTINKLFDDLGIEKTEWIHSSCDNNIPDYLKLSTLEREHVERHKDRGAAWAITDLFLNKFFDSTAYENPQEKLAYLESWKIDGKSLFCYGIWNILSMHLSYEAVNFVKEKGSFYNMRIHNQNAFDWISFLCEWHLVEKSYIPKKLGMQTLIDALERKLEIIGVDIYKNEKLVAVNNAQSTLIFSTGEQIVANHIVLALPPKALNKISFNAGLPSIISEGINSVIPIQIIMIHCLVNNPPWDTDTKAFNGENSYLRTAHFSINEDGSGNAFLYIDEPWYQYWRGLLELEISVNGTFVNNVSVGRHILGTLQKIFDQECDLEAWCIQDWFDSDSGAAVHLWKRGFRSKDVIENLASFTLSKNNSSTFHICGEAFSHLQGFFEGAVTSAERIVLKITKTLTPIE